MDNNTIKLSDIPTFQLVEELEKREAVECVTVKPFEDQSITVNGPAIILIVYD